jgi:hypothetical protein
MPLVILVIGGFVGAIIAMTGNVLTTRSANKLVYDIQDTLNRIESDVARSSDFLSTNNIDIQAPQGVNGDTDKFLIDSSTLILSTYATNKDPISESYSVVDKIDDTPLGIEIVYFVKDNTLWRRVIMPDDDEDNVYSFNDVWQQPSCKTVSAGSFCKVKDIRLIDGIGTDGFEVKYLDSTYTAINSPSEADITGSKTIKITISSTGGTAGREYSETGTIRATKSE